MELLAVFPPLVAFLFAEPLVLVGGVRVRVHDALPYWWHEGEENADSVTVGQAWALFVGIERLVGLV